jgi:hypothetical protein
LTADARRLSEGATGFRLELLFLRAGHLSHRQPFAHEFDDASTMLGDEGAENFLAQFSHAASGAIERPLCDPKADVRDGGLE